LLIIYTSNIIYTSHLYAGMAKGKQVDQPPIKSGPPVNAGLARRQRK